MIYHRFAYATPLQDGEESYPFKTRDGAAFAELSALLHKKGNEYGSLIFNAPYIDGEKKHGKEDFEFLGKDSTVVLTTRPPLDDKDEGNRRRLPRSHTHLEDAVFEECREFLEKCSRPQ